MDQETLRSEVADLFAEAQQREVDRAEAWLMGRAEKIKIQKRESARVRRWRKDPSKRRSDDKRHAHARLQRNVDFEASRPPPPAPMFVCECGKEALAVTVDGKIGLRCSARCRPPWLPEKPEVKRSVRSPTASIYEQQCRLIDHASELLEVVRSKRDLGWLTPREFGWKGFMAADMLAVLVRRGQVERKQVGTFGIRPTYGYRAKDVQQPCANLTVDAGQKRAEEVKPCLQCNGPGPSCPRSWCAAWYSGSRSEESAA